MPKLEWGHKRTCLNCTLRFYDLWRDPIICPYCQAPFIPEGRGGTRRSYKKETLLEENTLPIIDDGLEDDDVTLGDEEEDKYDD